MHTIPVNPVCNSQKNRENYCLDWWLLSRATYPKLALVTKELAKTGEPSQINPEEAWFEAPQKGGSCSAQNLMAFLRHTIMTHSPGSAEEKLGIYKMIKPFLFHWIPQWVDSNNPFKKFQIYKRTK